MALGLGDEVLPLALANEIAHEAARKGVVGYAAAHDEVAIDVAHAFPWSDGREMRRLLGRSEPLRDREVGVSAGPDLAIAPVLDAKPLDEVMALLAFLAAPHAYIALGVE